MKCTLCSAAVDPFYYYEKGHREYFQCTNCNAVLMNKAHYPSADEEIYRYESHNNDVNDPRYQKFVQPLVEKITEHYPPQTLGLDYGSGTGPVITKLLAEQGYQVNTFDPFFDNKPEVLSLHYDYIVSCEVIEHFHKPFEEFQKLRDMLKPNGALFLKTDPYTDDTDFHAWYYKSDETHVIFYHPDTMQWIRETFGFSKLEMDGRHFSLFL